MRFAYCALRAASIPMRLKIYTNGRDYWFPAYAGMTNLGAGTTA